MARQLRDRVLRKGDWVRFQRDDMAVWLNGSYGTVTKLIGMGEESVHVSFDGDDMPSRLCSSEFLTKVPTPDVSSIETIEEYLNDPH